MKTLSILFFCCAALLLLGAGCATGKEAQAADAKAEAKQEKPKPAPITDPKAEAFRYVAGVEKAIRTRDLKPWQEVVPVESREKITANHFKRLLAMVDRAGTFQRISYLGVLDHIQVQDYLWKFTFEKKDKDGKLQRVELLYLVRLYQKNGEGFYLAGSGFKKI